MRRPRCRRGVEGREWAARHADLLANFEGHQRLRPLNALLHLMEDLRRLRFRDRYRLFVGAEEASHLRRVPDEVIGLIGELHFGQHVAREELAFHIVLLSTADVHELLSRYSNLFKEII
jgi:hypothetical protein